MSRSALHVAALPLVLASAACGDDRDALPDAALPAYVEVALVPAVPTRDLDILFVVEDSHSLDMQTNLKNAFPAFVDALAGSPAGLPDLHVGAISGDLGTRGALDSEPGPDIGTGPGSCSGEGQGATLRSPYGIRVTDTFIRDVAYADGTRARNYTGTLADAMSEIVSLGASGCGFEQPIEAARRALDDHPVNTGFLRPSANLAIINVSDEDDCSFANSTLTGSDPALGPLQSFRCTRFGVTCDVGGRTPDEMNEPGLKDVCHSNENSPYVMSMAPYAAFFRGLKSDPRRVYFGSISGPPERVEVELRTPPGGGDAFPALAHACSFIDRAGAEVSDPGVRLSHLASLFERSSVFPYCTSDLTPAALEIARMLRTMTGDSCLARDIPLPADCVVIDQRIDEESPLRACSAHLLTDCYRLVEDARCIGEQKLRIEVHRSVLPPPDTMVSVRCRL